MIESPGLWIGFTVFILAMLALDLGVFQRRPHVLTTREAMSWFAFWTTLALIFNAGIWIFHERRGEAGLEFFTGFVVEKSLSIDNIFVFILIFAYFRVPSLYQHKVLFWGIIGAIVLRAGFIVGGLALMERFHWMIYLFGTFLLLTGIAMIRNKETKYDPENNWVIRSFRRFFPVSAQYDGNRFFTMENGRRVATPLFLVLLAVESSDIIFAVDSIPAIFAITSDPFIVYTSNIFAMLGLRSLYFAVSGFMQMFHFLHYGFASIILILGVKMLLSDVYKVPVAFSLALIVFILLICVIVSLLRPRRTDLKMLFQRTERLGLIPFRRLLLIENIIDLGDMKVKDAMRRKSGVRLLNLEKPWPENLKLISETHYSRYPVVTRDGERPAGIIHVKNLPFAEPPENITPQRLTALSRPCLEMSEDLPLEEALGRFQRRYEQIAVVINEQREWTGIISIEDVLEEIVGKIGDEFDLDRAEPTVSLADSMSPDRVILDLQAETLMEAIERIVLQTQSADVPVRPEIIIQAVKQREETMSTYLGKGLAIPHGRLDGIKKPMLAFARVPNGLPINGNNERAELIFLLLTPTGMARTQPRLLADMVGLMESEYVKERLLTATTALEVIEVVRAGQQIVLD
jgi:tellurite resistance protein TerC